MRALGSFAMMFAVGNIKGIVFAGIFGLSVVLLNSVAISKGLYWSIPEFDILMHFLGGAFIAYFLIEVSYQRGINKTGIFLGTFIVGVMWEVMEFLTGTTGATHDPYMKDTLTDLVMDMLGAAVILFLVKEPSFTSEQQS